jgi:hypothetical protein
MLKIIRRDSFFSVVTAALIIIFTSCAGLPKGTATGVPPKPNPFQVLGIVAISEIKPSTTDNLTCVTSNDYSTDLTYTWTASDGTIQGNGKQVIWSAPETPGNYSISVKVSSAGQEAAYSRSIKVTTNPYNNDQPDTTIYLKFKLPSSTLVTQSERCRIWSTEEIQCVVDGTNPSDLTYTWTAPTGKMAGVGIPEGKASKIGWITPGEAGQYTVSVLVTNKGGDSARGEVDFDVYCCHP